MTGVGGHRRADRMPDPYGAVAANPNGTMNVMLHRLIGEPGAASAVSRASPSTVVAVNTLISMPYCIPTRPPRRSKRSRSGRRLDRARRARGAPQVATAEKPGRERRDIAHATASSPTPTDNDERRRAGVP